MAALAASIECADATLGAEKARDGDVSIKYKISFLGFDLARATLKAKFERGLYAAEVGYHTTGIVKIFAAATGAITARGALDPDRVIPADFNQVSKENTKVSKVAMTLQQGAVTADNAEPAASPDPDRVPVRPEHRKNVLDPLSAMLIPVGKGKDPLSAACARTIPVFDGWTRFDITMSLKATKTVDRPDFKGDVVVCAVRWVPIAGHIPTRAGTKFMMNNKDIEVTLAPIADTGYLAPLHIGLETLHGHIDVDAIEFDGSSTPSRPAN